MEKKFNHPFEKQKYLRLITRKNIRNLKFIKLSGKLTKIYTIGLPGDIYNGDSFYI